MKNRLIQIFCEKSFGYEDIPKNFYLALNLSLGDERGDKLVEDLNRRELVGVKGIGGSSMKDMIKDWGNMREVLIIMQSEDVLKINQLTRVMYDNPEYLLSNGMKALRRLFAETSDEYTSIFTKMQDYILKVMDDAKVKGWISYNGAISDLSYEKGLVKRVNNSYDLAKILMNNVKNNEYSKEKGIDWWHKVVLDGIKLMGKLYSGEKEWMVKNEIIKIPNNSRIVVVESDYYKNEWLKRNGEDKFASRMANSSAVSQYEHFLELIDKLKSKWGDRVSVVSEKWVSDNKMKLVKNSKL